MLKKVIESAIENPMSREQVMLYTVSGRNASP